MPPMHEARVGFTVWRDNCSGEINCVPDFHQWRGRKSSVDVYSEDKC